MFSSHEASPTSDLYILDLFDAATIFLWKEASKVNIPLALYDGIHKTKSK